MNRLQLGVKFLERIPGTRRRLYQFTAIDDCARIRVQRSGALGASGTQRGGRRRVRVAACSFCTNGIDPRLLELVLDPVEHEHTQLLLVRVSGSGWHLETRDIRHVYIRPRTPRLNGKVERSHRVDDDEFYQLLNKDGISDDIHLFSEKLREWEDYYNYHRPHGGLGGRTPYERLLEKTRAEVLPGS